jgi:negative regulator of flagellin synthesis FlgM
MKVDKVASSPIPASQLNQPAYPQTDQPRRQTSVQPQTTIEQALTAEAAEQLQQLPDIDAEKVAAVKNALARGELALDIQALSSAVMRFHTGHE